VLLPLALLLPPPIARNLLSAPQVRLLRQKPAACAPEPQQQPR
jgi:hypothetical protein